MAKTPDIQPIFMDAAHKRDWIRDKAVASLSSVFPLVGNKYSLHAENIHVEPEDVGPEGHKKALLEAKTISEPVKATVVLKDASGKVVDKAPDYTLMRLPYLTQHGTFVVNGNSISVPNQLRMKPGVYTRRRRDEGIEAMFNLEHGSNFRMSMDPEKGTFNLDFGTTSVPLYPVLNKLGVSSKDLAKYWNKGLIEANQATAGKNPEKHLDKLFKHVVSPYKQEGVEDKAAAVREAFERATMNPEVNKRTLGESFSNITPTALLATSKKLLQAHQQNLDYDERDSLAYKRIYSIDDFVAERIKLDARNLKGKVTYKLNRTIGDKPEIKRVLPPGVFTKGITSFLSTSSLAQNPDQINPLEMLDSSTKVTSLGEGGIETDRAIPLESRRLHTTQAGFLDPVRTPESSHAGVDLRATMFSSRDKEGNLYVTLRNKKGKIEHVPITQVVDKAVAFPDMNLGKEKTVDSIRDGRLAHTRAKDIDYQIPNAHALYAPTTNLIPFLDSTDGMRATMGAKMMTQALPLEDAEAPLVQPSSYRPGMTMNEEIGNWLSPKAPVSGRIVNIKDGWMTIRPSMSKKSADLSDLDNGLDKEAKDSDVKIPIFNNFPLAAKTYLHHDLKVKPGDQVKEGDLLADSPFTRDGVLSLGKNLRVAYVGLRGMNTNDAVAISESAAKKLTSLHMYQEGLDVTPGVVVDREKHKTYYGNKFSREVYDKLDKDGLIKPGMTVNKGDLLVAGLQKAELSPDAAMLGKLHKSLVRPYMDTGVQWEHDVPGIVQDVVRSGNKIRLTVKTKEPAQIADKLSGRFGNKGVISAVIPDDQMIKDEQGRTIDVAISPTSVLTRLNPAQLLETAAAKVAEKTGKPLVVENFAPRDNVAYVKSLMKQHNVSDKETIFDPVSGKHIPGVLVGPQYTLKLFKTVDTQFSARGEGDGYDVDQQPGKGGVDGSKSLGRMEMNALVAHNARNIIKDAVTLKSERNDEYWRAYQLGLPLPVAKPTFAYNKFGALLNGAGLKMDKQGSKIGLMPLTDRDVMKMSRGAIDNPVFVRAKDLKPERGGLFDPAITGGLNGRNYAHVDLHEPVVNPVFERPARTLLGMTENEFVNTIKEKGGAGIKKMLSSIDIEQKEKETLKELEKTPFDKRDNLVKQLKYIRALKENKMTPDEAYVLSKIPVIPPVFRPLIPGKTGDLRVSDANYVTQDLMLANQALQETKDLTPSLQQDARAHLYDATKALFGLREPVSPRAAGRSVKGYLARIAGTNPKTGFFQGKLVRKQQDLSGRGTSAVDPNLDLDEVGLPEEMGWNMYSPFVTKGIIQRGYGATDAKKMVEERHPIAQDILQQELKTRPILINRAPTLHRFNVMAAYPKLVPGKSIRVPEFMGPPMNLDFDGDAQQIHVVVSPKAVEEARELTMSKLLLGEKTKNQLMYGPDQDAIVGLYAATAPAAGAKKVFKSKEDAIAAYHRGEISINTPVEIKR